MTKPTSLLLHSECQPAQTAATRMLYSVTLKNRIHLYKYPRGISYGELENKQITFGFIMLSSNVEFGYFYLYTYTRRDTKHDFNACTK